MAAPIEQSDLVSLEDYVAAECMKREVSLMSNSPIKLSECVDGASPDRLKETNLELSTTPVRQTETEPKKMGMQERIGTMFSAPQIREFISPLRRGETDRDADPNSG